MRGPLIAVAVLLAGPLSAAAAAPRPLSADHARADVRSTYGSGSFGRWTTDARGLPAYRYTVDEATAPQAAQAELGGRREAWHQLGNDHVVADAFNTGWVQLWSQDRTYEWTNAYDGATGHYAGGYGYLRLGGRTYSTLHADRAPGTRTRRVFGIGYAARRTVVPGARVDDRVYAPMGDDPVLLHDVTITNTSRRPERPAWFEYWDVNPRGPKPDDVRATAAPAYHRATRTVTVAQRPVPGDRRPLTIFAAALRGPVRGVDADAAAFFGGGGRAAPEAVAAGRLTGALAPPSPTGRPGRAMAAFRAPLRLAPGRSVTLRYAYGYAHARRVAPLVARRRAARDPFATSERAWAAFVPQVSFGGRARWLSRELEWDAYMLRSGASYEECAGHHVISQGGYYQYALDFQGAFRDPLQHALPLIYARPALAREVLLYSAGEQSASPAAFIPYARVEGCVREESLGVSDDLDLYLLWTAAEYGLASRDTGFFDRRVPWAGGGRATLWRHLKIAVAHQESQRTPDGLYAGGTNGDWSDLLTKIQHMTESTLVAAQAAYVYPRLAALARLRGDRPFARRLDRLAGGLRRAVRRQWTPRGWYTRGKTAAGAFGTGAIYEEPQPFALLAGVPRRAQARRLVANVRRYLSGVGAPGGPSPIGSAQSPADDDPGVTEHTDPSGIGVGDNHAVFVGGSWYALDGWLAWALGAVDGVVPHARAYAFSELRRNTLAAHAHAYPDNWDGVISVDDACRAWYSTDPAHCGVGLTQAYDTQIMHQPAWGLYDAVMLAGVTPTARGYTITPHLPLRRFSLRFARIGVAGAPRRLRGYVRVARPGPLRLRVAPPAGARGRALVAYAGGRRVKARRRHGLVVFTLRARPGRAADWAVVARPNRR